MKKFVLFIVLLISCSTTSSNNQTINNSLIINYQNLDGKFIEENLSDKNTIIIFWADYWGICRQELPVLEDNLHKLINDYDVIALAHSDLESTNDWVKNNLKGILKIGLSSKEIRDKYKVIGQPITIILNTNGEIIFREFGYLPTNGF